MKDLTLLLDYDGTLVPFAPTPEQAIPDPDLLALLDRLARHPGIALHLVTGRDADTLDRWFGALPADLWAEHGAWHRSADRSAWTPCVSLDAAGRERADAWLTTLAAETPGSFVERKRTGMAWHYRGVEPGRASVALVRARTELPGVLVGAALEPLEGHAVLELRARGASKGHVVRSLLDADRMHGRVVAIGDDATDEEMFAALPMGALAIRVGAGPTRSHRRLADATAVRAYLARLAENPLDAGPQGDAP